MRLQVLAAVLLGCCAIAFLFWLHPRLGVRDVDGYAYVMGARSLHAGRGYQSLTGEALNHWPPGYSLLLSLFADSLTGAMVVNYLSYGLATGLLFYLLRWSGWTWQAAGGVTVALAAGFFRLLANAAHADIFTYALFLLGIYVVARPPESRVLACLLWSLLIPVKLIAVVFLPPAVGADWIVSRRSAKELARAYWPGALLAGAAVAGVLWFNYATIGASIPHTHAHSSLASVSVRAKEFFGSIPRELLLAWHGSLLAPFPRIAFPLGLLLAAACFVSLRPVPERRWFQVYAVLCLACCGLLLLVRSYGTSVRLVGYGLILLLVGFRPKRWANTLWLAYGLTGVVIACVNAFTVDSLGSNDGKYAGLAAEVRAYYHAPNVLATNSFHILDLQANVASEPVGSGEEAAEYGKLLWVTLPSFDPGSSPVTTMARPGPGWCAEKQFVGAILFTPCGASSR